MKDNNIYYCMYHSKDIPEWKVESKCKAKSQGKSGKCRYLIMLNKIRGTNKK